MAGILILHFAENNEGKEKKNKKISDMICRNISKMILWRSTL